MRKSPEGNTGRNWKRFSVKCLSLLLVLCLFVGLMPAAAYADSDEAERGRLKSINRWRDIVDIVVVSDGVIGIKENKKLITTFSDDDHRIKAEKWKRIVSVMGGNEVSDPVYALNSLGKLNLVNYGLYNQERDLDSFARWPRIDDLAVGESGAYSISRVFKELHYNGSMDFYVFGDFMLNYVEPLTGKDPSLYKDIHEIRGLERKIKGLKGEKFEAVFGDSGFENAQQVLDYLHSWDGLMHIVCYGDNLIGFREDGQHQVFGAQVEAAADIIKNAVAVEYGLYDNFICLYADGTVAVGGGDGKYKADVEKLTNVTAIDAGKEHLVCALADGSFVAIGSNDKGQCDISAWENIVNVSTSDYCTFGITDEGKVKASGEVYYWVDEDGQFSEKKTFVFDQAFNDGPTVFDIVSGCDDLEIVAYPAEETMLEEYETMYVVTTRDKYIKSYCDPQGQTERDHVVQSGTEITVLAQDGDYSLGLYLLKNGKEKTGWILTSQLMSESEYLESQQQEQELLEQQREGA